ncbi:MAG: 2-C-methyl-D-erythritol 4-phosphate cytidylyltransferase [Clostridiales bacterium]|jgi:2-C-methyl-D-erythritol 4-phosphate cytidylyltransferase|nr:2-C-methyl-D-erythritol 4-phosphate cytidylyltransferase [Eubacteriales bacterium]MDH7567586.1 2-C-methyl-D-erythritol 4-phosphate cytidylyltransferase [Clostridiales bacterium]
MKRASDLFVSAVIVAAGRGTRMNMDINKQYIEICDKPVLARTLDIFQNYREIDEIVLVVNEQDLVYCKQSIVDPYSFDKVKTLVVGGQERQQSVLNGLKEVDAECDIVLIHDGARPFVDERILADNISAARELGAVCTAVPVKDTIKTSGLDGFIGETLDRSLLWAVQTPQTFKYDLIMNAHLKALQDGFKGTDDAVLVERMGGRIKLVMGSYNNIKITTQEDLVIAEAITENYFE